MRVSTACLYHLFVLFLTSERRFMHFQVQKHIFTETNTLIKSIQVFLNALNELRLCYIMERSISTSVQSKRVSSKVISTLSFLYLLISSLNSSLLKSESILGNCPKLRILESCKGKKLHA